MEAATLNLNIDYVASSGVVLSVEQKAALQSSLVILQTQQKFKHVQFWGKILGIRNDYFIVEGIGKDELKDRKRLYRFVFFYLIYLIIPGFQSCKFMVSQTLNVDD